MSRHTSLFSFRESVPIQLSPPRSPSFHPHSFVSEIRSVLGGCSRFRRCCYLISVLSSHVSVGVGPQELVAVTWTRRLSSAVRIETLSATAPTHFWPLLIGLKTYPLP